MEHLQAFVSDIKTFKIASKLVGKHTQKAYKILRGKYPEAEEEDREVHFGAHHDAWTYGTADNVGGTCTVLEVPRG